jgi:hypothetical protein
MRSTTFALLGIVAAMALGLVAMVSSQGVPVLPGLPLPGLSTERDRVDDARAIATPGPAQGLGPAAEVPVAGSATGDGAEPKRTDSSSLSGSRQLATAQNPLPTDPGVDGTPSDEAPVPVPTAPPPVEAPATAPAPQPAPAAPTVGTPPGKATAVVDASQNDDGENARGDEPKTQEKRDARGGRAGGGTGRGDSSPVAPPSQAQDDADTQNEGSDEASSQAEIDEDGGRGGSRGHGYRRFGR